MNAVRLAATGAEVGATALWTGASAGFAFVSAPIAFRLVADRDVFAQITEGTLGRLATLSYVAGGLAATVAFLRAAFEPDDGTNDAVRGIAGISALVLIAYHQLAIVPAMARAQAAMGGLNSAAEDDPRRIAYRALHQRSTRAFGAALLLGVAQLALAATRPNVVDDDVDFD